MTHEVMNPAEMQRLLEKASGAVVMHVNGAEGDVDMRGNAVSACRTIRAGWDVLLHARHRAPGTHPL